LPARRAGLEMGREELHRACDRYRVKVPQTPLALLVLSVCRSQPQN
jgi:hypothetical protein